MTTELPPIRRQIVVTVPPDEAFRQWTEHITDWWPLGSHSVHGATSTVAFTDGRLVETAADGQACVWGTVRAWDVGRRLVTSWHPGGQEDLATEVEVLFEAVPVGGSAVIHTLVTLIHRGWENRPNAVEVHGEYRSGWQHVLGLYGAHAVPETADDREYLILRHSAGPAAPVDGPLFAHPDFGEHPAFLGRLADQGVLVAAGPVAPVDGRIDGAQGMAVLKIPTGTAAEFIRQAREDDRSVTRGLLTVEPLVWRVNMEG